MEILSIVNEKRKNTKNFTIHFFSTFTSQKVVLW